MRLTPEQNAQVEEARAAGEPRVTVPFTTEQKAEWQEAVRQELDGKEANIALGRKIKAAAEQPGFLGDVRRAMAQSRRPVPDLAKAIGVDARLLADFRAGDVELPSSTLDRLLDLLGLRLMQDIRR